MSNGAQLLHAAQKYAENGWPVFPCGVDKKPLTSNGFKDATTDPLLVREFWQYNPSASIGFPTGKEWWVLDVDMPDGPATLADLEAKHGALPTTVEQKTGGGGRQLFFLIPPGRDIRNSARKIGPGLDVRGVGGYVILPPSNHPSGNEYSWINTLRGGTTFALAPAWLVDLVAPVSMPSPARPTYKPTQAKRGGTSEYGAVALMEEGMKVSSTPDGGRNQALNDAAFSIGQLIAGGEVDYADAESVLTDAAMSCGLQPREISKTIASGFRAGAKEPRTAPVEKMEKMEIVEKMDSMENDGNNGNQWKAVENNGNTPLEFSGNMKAEVREFIGRTHGSFTLRDIDDELGIKTAILKKRRSTYLSEYVKEGIIKKDPSVGGKFHTVDHSCEWLDWDEPTQECDFPCELPLGLSELVILPPKGIVLVAGTTSAGKTAIALDLMRRNLGKNLGLMYLPSEMGNAEVKNRASKFVGTPFDAWREMKVPRDNKTSFAGFIQHHNANGLTVIDYLEERDGEYFKMASHIREIYDALQDGVAWVCVQKKTGSLFGRGGEAVNEKPRLVLNLDSLFDAPSCQVCSVRLAKAKIPRKEGTNPQGLERHFTLSGGWRIEYLTGWTRCDEKQREAMVAGYKQRFGNGERPF